ncbi:MAG: hypothetical protein EA399_06965 [Desulfovibrionales bacterium]|nr:MAG: hypothetical protein EA399_06965 [Desulfovibrionales bacterium]
MTKGIPGCRRLNRNAPNADLTEAVGLDRIRKSHSNERSWGRLFFQTTLFFLDKSPAKKLLKNDCDLLEFAQDSSRPFFQTHTFPILPFT